MPVTVEFAGLGPVWGRSQAAGLARSSGLTLLRAASRRHGAQRLPGCSVALQHVATCLRLSARLSRRSAAPAAGSREPGPGAVAADPAPGEQGSSRMTGRSRIAAMILSSPPPQFGQSCMSMSNTRSSSRAQLMCLGRAWAISTSHGPAAATLAASSSLGAPAAPPARAAWRSGPERRETGSSAASVVAPAPRAAA
jgi:hypothetical protein